MSNREQDDKALSKGEGTEVWRDCGENLRKGMKNEMYYVHVPTSRGEYNHMVKRVLIKNENWEKSKEIFIGQFPV